LQLGKIMKSKKVYIAIVFIGLFICLFSYQNCAQGIDPALLEDGTEELNSEGPTNNNENNNSINERLELDIYTVPETIVTVGRNFAVVVKVKSNHTGLTYQFKKNQISIPGNVFDNGTHAQSSATVLNNFNERNAYSIDVFDGSELLTSQVISLNANAPAGETPVEETVTIPNSPTCAPPVASATRNFTTGKYIISWTHPARYNKVELLSDKSTPGLVVSGTLIAVSNFTEVDPTSRNTLNKSIIRYQLLVTCTDNTQSYSNILSLNLNL